MKKTKESKKSRMAVDSTAYKKEYKPTKEEVKSENVSRNHIAKVIFSLILCLVAVVFVCMSGAFTISEIVVEGNVNLSKDQMISISGIEKGTNLFALSKKGITDKLKENPYVDQVKIQRILPDQAKIKVVERKIEYALPLANSFVFIDHQGYILEISNTLPNVPILLGFTTDLSNVKQNHQLDEMDLQKIKNVTRIMEIATNHNMQELITKIDISNAENYALHFDTEGKIAYLGKGTELNTRFLYIKAILKEQQGKTGKIFVNMDLNAEYVYFREEAI